MSTTKVVGRTYKGFKGYWLVDEDGQCVAKTCAGCKKELTSDHFAEAGDKRYNLASWCITCNRDGSSGWMANQRAKLVSRSVDEIMKSRHRLRPDGVKRCIRCKDSLLLSMFSDSIHSPDGLQAKCRRCSSELSYMYDNETVIGGEGSKGSVRKREKRSKNRDRSPGEVLADQQKIHPDGVKTCISCRSTLNLSEFYTDKENGSGLDFRCKPCAILRSKEKSKDYFKSRWKALGVPLVCYVCLVDCSDSFHADHIVPKRLGGSDDIHNRLPLCPTHNGNKWMTPLEIWLRDSVPEMRDEVLDRVSGYGVDYRVPDGEYDGIRVLTDVSGLQQWEKVEAV